MKWENLEAEMTNYQCCEVWFLRQWGCSWRRIAEIMSEKYNGDWGDIQAAGEDMCKIAEDRLKIPIDNWFY